MKVKKEVKSEYFKTSLKILFKSFPESVNRFARYHPTGKPNNMQKNGTPIPTPTNKVSKIT